MRYWTTDSHPVAEQFSYWREVICQAFTPLATDRVPADRTRDVREPGIPSWVRSTLLTSTNCAEVSSRTQLISHGDAEVRRTESDDIFMNLMVRGRCVVRQGGRAAIVSAGGFSFVDTTSTYSQEYIEDPARREWRVVSFRIPRRNLVPLLARPDGFTAVAHTAGAGGIANVAASTVLSTWGNINRLDRAGADAAESALNAVLAAAAGGSDELRDTGRASLDASLRASINRYVAARLQGGVDLSASAVARRFQVSTRKLHALYQGTERTFAQTVLSLRVEACARDLTAGNASSLSDIAARWGFCDLSHMNRVFRVHHDCLPSDYRVITPGRNTLTA